MRKIDVWKRWVKACRGWRKEADPIVRQNARLMARGQYNNLPEVPTAPPRPPQEELELLLLQLRGREIPRVYHSARGSLALREKKGVGSDLPAQGIRGVRAEVASILLLLRAWEVDFDPHDAEWDVSLEMADEAGEAYVREGGWRPPYHGASWWE
jgi:hypothetical protein